MTRRRFLGGLAAAGALASPVGRAAAAGPSEAGKLDDVPVIDTHVHFFDPSRPQGIPWPAKTNAVTYRTSLPEQMRRASAGLAIRGVIAVECSTWLEDNQWVLGVAEKDPLVVGTVGDLEPGKPAFREQLDRFCKNPLFRGIRYGTLWGRDMPAEVSRPAFLSDMKALAGAGLELDTAKMSPALAAAIVRLTDAAPELRVVIDHMGQADPPAAPAERAAYEADMRRIAERPQVYVKVSEVLRHVGGRVPEDLGAYRAKLDELWGLFGEDRLLYGSDWPNCNQWAPYPVVFKVVRDYFAEKGRAAAEKFFWRNSTRAYRWVRRDAGQPDGAA